jgi:hypothetical protein
MSRIEERLQGGERRERLGIGDRYKALLGDEQAIQSVGRSLPRVATAPACFCFVLTVGRTYQASQRERGLVATNSERSRHPGLSPPSRHCRRTLGHLRRRLALLFTLDCAP